MSRCVGVAFPDVAVAYAGRWSAVARGTAAVVVLKSSMSVPVIGCHPRTAELAAGTELLALVK